MYNVRCSNFFSRFCSFDDDSYFARLFPKRNKFAVMLHAVYGPMCRRLVLCWYCGEVEGGWVRVWELGRLLGGKYDDGNGMWHRGIREHQIDIDGLGIFKFRPFCWICENQTPSRRSANNTTKQWYSRPVCWFKCGFCLLFGTVALDGLNSNLANWNACNACIFCGGRLSRESFLKRILIDWMTAVFLFSFSKVLMFQFSIKNWSRLCSIALFYFIQLRSSLW